MSTLNQQHLTAMPARYRSVAAAALVAVAAGSVLSVSPDACGATTLASWVAPDNGLWIQGVRWSSNPFYPNLGSPAGASYDVVIDAVGRPYTATLGAIVAEVETLDLCSPDLRFVHNLGGLVVGPYQGENGTPALTVGAGATYHLVSGPLHLVGHIGHSIVGRGGAGTFLHDDGAIHMSAPRFIVGQGGATGAGTGTYIMSGPTARWTIDPDHIIHWHTVGTGLGGTGTMIFRNNAAPQLFAIEIGTLQGHGTLIVSSGAHVQAKQFRVGGSGGAGSEGCGTILLDDPAGRITVDDPISSGQTIIGVDSDVGGGTVLISAGTFANTGSTHVRRSGLLDISGGVTTHRAVAVLGQLRLDGSGQIVCSTGSFGLIGGGSAAITGGSLVASRLRILDAGSQTLHISGGDVAVGSFEMLSGTATVSGDGGLTASGSLALGAVAGAAAQFVQTGGIVTTPSFIMSDGSATYAGGTLNVSTLSLTGGRFAMPGGAQRELVVQSLHVAGTGRIDLGDNRLVIDYQGTSSPIVDVRDDVATAYAGGSWDGPGITSSLADASAYGVGYFESADARLILQLVRFGDANLDAEVDLQDFNRLAANFGATDAFWAQGDFNYDGIVNLQDFNRLAANFGLSASGPWVRPEDWAALASAVPEPTGAAWMLGALTGATRARRRRFTPAGGSADHSIPATFTGVVGRRMAVTGK